MSLEYCRQISETSMGFPLGIGREDWGISMDIIRRTYSKFPDNREFLTAMKFVNWIGGDIPRMLIYPEFNNWRGGLTTTWVIILQ